MLSREIQLLTNEAKFVAIVDLPPFEKLPEVVIWGERTFTIQAGQHLESGPVLRSTIKYPRYREAFAFVSLTPSPGRPMPEPVPPPPVDETARDVLGAAVAPGVADTTDRGDGQQRGYVVLSSDERAKGFVRPVRRTYRHVGIVGPLHPTRDLTDEEHSRYDDIGYVKFEAYPDGSSTLGRFWTRAQLDSVGKGCGTETTMGVALAETYARSPGFYGGTFCTGCGAHFPVGKDGEFVWANGSGEERVGT